MASNSINEFAHLQIPLEEIVTATHNFADENIIGKGGFGNVYKGKLMQSGKMIDISCRRLDRRHGQGDVEFWKEISVLSGLEHENIVSLVGFCDENNEKIIITEYYPKGSLSMHLTDTTNLTWKKRLRISRGIFYAIEYLHEKIGGDYYIIHRNINAFTILLDDDWSPKLSGFEFSIKHLKHQKDHVFRCEAIGTKGYMDPEVVKTGGFTHKSDIYSFGIVLFEIMCGRKAFDPKADDDDMFLAPLAKLHYENDTLKDMIVNPDLRDQMGGFSFFLQLSRAAYYCIQEKRSQRSDVKSVRRIVDSAMCSYKIYMYGESESGVEQDYDDPYYKDILDDYYGDDDGDNDYDKKLDDDGEKRFDDDDDNDDNDDESHDSLDKPLKEELGGDAVGHESPKPLKVLHLTCFIIY
uniref:probable serine/threonine-protein kinase PBL7 n=1 Tax=Erigeron canadensis TaxID=72917 RepID=UPI001CB97700|nr:probable serine/threonine-protein kinase PBL7 [Erigeron canadensis]